MDEHSFTEKRKDYRIPHLQKIIFTDGQKSKTSFASNLSRGGLFAMTLEPFPIDSKLHVLLMLPNQPYSLCFKTKVAHIVFDHQRCEVDCGMGLQFLELSESNKSILNLHILNEKLAYQELKKLLLPSRPNLNEIDRIAKKIPYLSGCDLALLKYRVERICTIFEHPTDERASAIG